MNFLTISRATVLRGLSFKWLITPLLVIALIASNIATLLSSSFHEGLYRAFAAQLFAMAPKNATKILQYATVTKNSELAAKGKRLRLKNNSLRSQQKFLSSKASELSSQVGALVTRNSLLDARIRKASIDAKKLSMKAATLSRQNTSLEEKITEAVVTAKKQKQAVRSFKVNAVKRLVKSKVVNLASAPARATPAIGAIVTAGVLAYEIYDGCGMLEDIVTLERESNVLEETEGQSEICGFSLPSTVRWDDIKPEVMELGRSLGRSSLPLDWWK
jgi:hypothetical protein